MAKHQLFRRCPSLAGPRLAKIANDPPMRTSQGRTQGEARRRAARGRRGKAGSGHDRRQGRHQHAVGHADHQGAGSGLSTGGWYATRVRETTEQGIKHRLSVRHVSAPPRTRCMDGSRRHAQGQYVCCHAGRRQTPSSTAKRKREKVCGLGLSHQRANEPIELLPRRYPA